MRVFGTTKAVKQEKRGGWIWEEKGEATGSGEGRMEEKGEGQGVEAEGKETLKFPTEGRIAELGEGSQVVHNPRLIGYQEAWNLFDYLNSRIPKTRPNISVFWAAPASRSGFLIFSLIQLSLRMVFVVFHI